MASRSGGLRIKAPVSVLLQFFCSGAGTTNRLAVAAQAVPAVTKHKRFGPNTCKLPFLTTKNSSVIEEFFDKYLHNATFKH